VNMPDNTVTSDLQMTTAQQTNMMATAYNQMVIFGEKSAG